jgi:phosphoribosylanthranilate isomerase
MKVKICGLTNLEDALTAVHAGADYLGFIFYPPSKRGIAPEAAREIASHLRHLPDCPLLVGVFVDETADTMARILDDCHLDLAQLSGNEVPSLLGNEQSAIYGRAYKALRPTSFAEAEAEAEWYTPPLLHDGQPTLLMDTHHPTLLGGTGETGNWHIGAQLAQQVPRFMLAGGLTADNVATAIQQVQPFAVDVASGVEASPGRKDPELVRTFIANAKQLGNQ